MNRVEIQEAILRHLYENWLTDQSGSVFVLLQNLRDVNEKDFTRAAEDLEEEGLISGVGHSSACDLTAFGILQAEERNLVDEKIRRGNEDLRKYLLKAAYDSWQEDGREGEVSLDDIPTFDGAADAFNNAKVLEDLGLLEYLTFRSVIST